MSAIEYVTGNESHTSNWGKFYVKGLEKLAAKEDDPRNEHDRHASYQCYVALAVPPRAIFTIFEQSGDKRGTDVFEFLICQSGGGSTQQIKSAYGSGCIEGEFEIIAQASGKVKAPRLMDWWQARPTGTDPLEWARHCATHINTRGLKDIPAIVRPA